MYNNELYHYGVKGMKWGHRKKRDKFIAFNKAQAKNQAKTTSEAQTARKAKIKKAAKIGAATVGTVLAIYGSYKLSKYLNDTNAKYHRDVAEKFVKNFDKSYSSNVEKMTSKIADQRKRIDATYRMGVKPEGSVQDYNTYIQQLSDYKKYAKRAKYKAVNRELKKIDTDSVIDKARNTYKYVKKKRR